MDDSSGSTESGQSPQGAEAEPQRESGWDDWWTSDRLDALGWAAIFVWGAVVVLATYTDFSDEHSWWDGWGVFFIGAGVVVTVEAFIRLTMPEYRWKVGWTLMWGIVFLSFGLSVFYGPAWLALVLLALAVATVAGALRNTG